MLADSIKGRIVEIMNLLGIEHDDASVRQPLQTCS
jgi:hypothetical protein